MLCLFIAAVVWGTAFVAQSIGMDYVGGFTYGATRTFLGGLILIPVVLVSELLKPKEKRTFAPQNRNILRNTLIGSICCGSIYMVASSLQQFGIGMTSAGKSGFLTALYIIIVPILGIFIGKKAHPIVAVSAVLALIGFWLLSMSESFSVATGDYLLLGCAFSFSCHILTVDHFSEKGIDGVLLSCCQFLFAGLVMFIPMFLFESPDWNSILAARDSILYAGIMSCGVAYTFQILGQKDTPPAAACLIMSLESVVAAISGWIILDERLSTKELIGCAVVFIAVILAQWPSFMPSKKK